MFRIFLILTVAGTIIGNVISEREKAKMKLDLNNVNYVVRADEEKEFGDLERFSNLIDSKIEAHFQEEKRRKRETQDPDQKEKPHKRTHDITAFLCVSDTKTEQIKKFNLMIKEYNCQFKHYPIRWDGQGTALIDGFLGSEPGCMPTVNEKINRDTCLPFTRFYINKMTQLIAFEDRKIVIANTMSQATKFIEAGLWRNSHFIKYYYFKWGYYNETSDELNHYDFSFDIFAYIENVVLLILMIYMAYKWFLSKINKKFEHERDTTANRIEKKIEALVSEDDEELCECCEHLIHTNKCPHGLCICTGTVGATLCIGNTSRQTTPPQRVNLRCRRSKRIYQSSQVVNC